MSLLFAENLADLSNTTDIAYRFVTVPATSYSIVSWAGGKAIRCAGGDSVYLPLSPSLSTVITGCRMASNGNYPAAGPRILNNTGVLFSIRVVSASVLGFYDATNTQIGTWAGFRNFDSYVEVKLTPGSSGTVVVKHYTGGAVTTVLNTTGTFHNAGTDEVTQISWGQTSATFGGDFTDLHICDTNGSYNNDFLGEQRIYSVRPSGDGAVHTLTPDSGSVLYSRVNEQPLDGDTSYIEGDTSGQIATFTCPSFPGSGNIRAMQIINYARSVAGGTANIAGVVRISGTNYAASSVPVGGTYQGIASIFETDPSTSSPWTASGANGAEKGVKIP